MFKRALLWQLFWAKTLQSTTQTCLFKIHFNSIYPPSSRHSKLVPRAHIFIFTDHFHACHMTAQLIFLGCVALIERDGEFKLWRSSLRNFLHPFTIPFALCPNILRRTRSPNFKCRSIRIGVPSLGYNAAWSDTGFMETRIRSTANFQILYDHLSGGREENDKRSNIA